MQTPFLPIILILLTACADHALKAGASSQALDAAPPATRLPADGEALEQPVLVIGSRIHNEPLNCGVVTLPDGWDRLIESGFESTKPSPKGEHSTPPPMD